MANKVKCSVNEAMEKATTPGKMRASRLKAMMLKGKKK
jgi:hypothetical protein